jgi:hypothetical protein
VPKWRPDGRELYDLSPDGRLMAAPVGQNSAALVFGIPQPLLRMPGESYEVAPDGRRFLVLEPVEETTRTGIDVVVNWLGDIHPHVYRDRPGS